VQAAAP
jgi:hypothetical protein